MKGRVYLETGLTHVYTGDGKGKTTAALGVVMRSLGWKRKIAVIQFLKSPEYACGESAFFKQLGLEFYQTGIGFSWQKSPDEQRQALKNAWKLACEKLADPQYDLVVLDEIICVLCEKNFPLEGILSEQIVIDTLKRRPVNMDVILTGRGAGQKLMDYADLVTQMKMIKHPYQKGIKAKKGIEY